MARNSGSGKGIFGANTRTRATRVGDMTYVKHDQFIGRSLSNYGEWAQIEIDAMLRYIAPGDFVIDVGANIGFHALSFARKVGCSGAVWAFEPDPVNGLLLSHNILQANLDDVVIPFDLVVSDTLGLCRFRTVPITQPENFGHTGVDAKDGYYPRVSLPLDSLPITRAPSLIKIDVEGHELAALGGMVELIEQHRPVLSIEADTPEEVEANGAFVAALGYDVYSLVVNAYNPHNFAENPTDIWKGNGRCANLLCVVPGQHEAPHDLELVRRADSHGHAITRVSKGVGAAYSAGAVGHAQSAESPIQLALGATQAEIRQFVTGFLKTTYGKLDPVTDAALVNGALDFLAANGPHAEGLALQRLIVVGVEAFADALGSRVTAETLAQVRIERDRLRESLDALNAENADLVAQHGRTVADLTSRLNAAIALEARLGADLAQQADIARRELAEALAKLALAESNGAAVAEAHDALQHKLAAAVDDLAEAKAIAVERDALRVELSGLHEQRDRMISELAETQQRSEQEVAEMAAQIEMLTKELADARQNVADQGADMARQQEKLTGAIAEAQQKAAEEVAEMTAKVEAAHEAAGQHSLKIAELNDINDQLTSAVNQMRQERAELQSLLSDAQERLALQARQLRHFRVTKG